MSKMKLLLLFFFPCLGYGAIVSDPLYFLQWGLNNNGGSYSVDINDFTTKKIPAYAGEDIDNKNIPAMKIPVVVAVLDSGIDLNHPDLKDALVSHESECGQTEIKDHDGNGYPLDCHGWNFAAEDNGHGKSSSSPLPKTLGILGTNHVQDYVGHGTHVAGIIAARKNGFGTEGVAPLARILAVRVISGEPQENIRAQELANAVPAPEEANLKIGTGLGDIVARGVLYAIRSGAKIINMSLGWPDPYDSEELRRMIELAHQKGILIVAAAGNDSTDNVIFPCRYDGVICVGAHGPDGAATFFTNFGYGVDLLAPGWHILSTFPTHQAPQSFTDQIGYESKDGSSMAAPFVSGILAYMLGLGMEADEAYARLLLGARPTRPSQVEDPQLFANSSWSGNADLANSLKVEPQALILPAHKNAIPLRWDRISKSLPIEFALQDHWLAAEDIHIHIEPLDSYASLQQSDWSFATWAPLEEKILQSTLQIKTPRINSELDFRVSISIHGKPAKDFYLRAEITAPIDQNTRESLNILPLVSSDGSKLQRNYDEIRTVFTNTNKEREYLGIQYTQKERVLDLLVEIPFSNGRAMKLQGSVILPKNGNQILALHKISDKNKQYVLLEGLPLEKARAGQAQETQLSWYDENLQQIGAAVKVDRAITYLTEDFQWQSRAGELVPTWYGLGLPPPSERKPYNPWKPSATNEVDFRLYFLTSDGSLHTIAMPPDYPMLIALAPLNAEQKKKGIVSAILARGNDYALEYARADLIDGVWQNIKTLELPIYHNIQGLIASKTLSLDLNASNVGVSFSGFSNGEEGPGASRRSTWILQDGSVGDFTAFPLRNFDSITDTTGIFLGTKRKAAFTLTKYEIQYHDLTNQNTVMCSQKRFSFLPSILSFKSFFPTLVEDEALLASTGESRAAALYVPGDFIFSKSTQVIVPEFDAQGKATKLMRPALFHLESAGNCTALPTIKTADENGPGEFVFFCGDRFLSVPLRF